MNYVEMAIVVVISVVLSLVLSLFTLGEVLKKRGPEMVQQLMDSENWRQMQTKGVESRLNKTANSKIAEDIMTNTPLSSMMSILSEDTRAYLKEHPEVLPSVLQNYAGTVDMVLKLSPQLSQIMGLTLNKAQTPSYDL